MHHHFLHLSCHFLYSYQAPWGFHFFNLKILFTLNKNSFISSAFFPYFQDYIYVANCLVLWGVLAEDQMEVGGGCWVTVFIIKNLSGLCPETLGGKFLNPFCSGRSISVIHGGTTPAFLLIK